MEHGFCVRSAGRLVLLTLLWGNLASAADPPPAEKPLLWAGDPEGGAPTFPSTRTIGVNTSVSRSIFATPCNAKSAGRSSSSPIRFPALGPGLLRGDFDFAMNGVEDTSDRKERFRLSRPYYIYSLQLVCRRDDDRFRSVDDCKMDGVVVGTLANTAASRLLTKKGIPMRAYPDQTTPYKDLEQKQVDAVLLDLPIALQYTKRDPDLPRSSSSSASRWPRGTTSSCSARRTKAWPSSSIRPSKS